MVHKKGMEQVGGMEGWRKYPKENVIAALIKAGTKLGASEILGCDRGTLTRYIDDDPEIEQAVQEAKEILIDLAETKLKENVEDGQQPAISFVLKTLGKDRGYVVRVENTGKGGGPIESEIKVKSNNQKLLDTIETLSRQVEEEDTTEKKPKIVPKKKKSVDKEKKK